jgi:hypothetical protein
MTPLLVVQNNHVVRLTEPVTKAAHERGIAVHDVSSGEQVARRPLPLEGGPWGPILLIGSSLFPTQWLDARPDMARWVHRDETMFDAALWAERMGGRMLNAGGHATTIADFASSVGPAMHVRPRDGMKLVGEKVRTESQAGSMSVPGIVVTPAQVTALGIDPATPIWASPVREIRAEVRTWMIGGRAVAGSTYRIDGEHARHGDHAFVREAALAAVEDHGRWSPDRHYVVDHALTDDGWLIVEYNPIHSSGWYDADPGAVLEAFMVAESDMLEGKRA